MSETPNDVGRVVEDESGGPVVSSVVYQSVFRFGGVNRWRKSQNGQKRGDVVNERCETSRSGNCLVA